jgi:GNAT superfamily N-acetyltransferase
MPDERLSLAHRGLANALVHLAAHAPGGVSEEADGILLFAGEHLYPGAYCNGLLRFDGAAEHALARAHEFFGGRRRGFVVWTRGGVDDELEQCCRRAGWTERPPLEGMPILAREGALEAKEGDAVRTARIATEDDARSYLSLVASAYGLGDAPFEVQRATLFAPAAATAPGAIGVLARRGDAPAAGGMVVLRDGVACVLWIATAPDARGQGLGGAVLRALVEAVRDEGASFVCMQSSQQGLPLWTAMGFERIGHYRRFLAPPVTANDVRVSRGELPLRG